MQMIYRVSLACGLETENDFKEAGVLSFSVGIENPADIIADLRQALDKVD